MDEHAFKQRIVGAIVLVALAVIFVPMLLSGGKDRDFIDADTVIPEKPPALKQIQVLEIENPVPPPAPASETRIPVDEKSPPETRKPAPDQTRPAPASPKPRAPAATTKPEPATDTALAWAVQVGSFRKQANALALAKKLKARGHPAFVEKIVLADGKQSYRVRVGPYVKKDEAEGVRKRLQKQFQLKGLVVRHP